MVRTYKYDLKEGMPVMYNGEEVGHIIHVYGNTVMIVTDNEEVQKLLRQGTLPMSFEIRKM